jgi:hypothetical protein
MVATRLRAALLAALFYLSLPGASRAAAMENYTYDPVGCLTDVAYQNGGSIHYTHDANGNILSIVTSLATAVEGNGAPFQFALGPTTPNPGSGPRTMAFTIPARGHVTLRVFDVLGREVATLYDRVLVAGRYNAQFSTDRWGNGVYFYRLQAGSRVRAGRLVVLR